MRSQTLIALGVLSLAAAGLGACATGGAQHAQMPAPADQAAVWRPQDRLYRSVSVDYVGGLDNRRFKSVLQNSLDQAGLLAPTSAASRYSLQINAAQRGRDGMVGYRLTNRSTRAVIFDKTVAGDARNGAQSITSFVVQLSRAEGVPFATVVPCLDSAEVLALKGSLTARGLPWRTDDCQAYRERKADDGLRFSSR